MKFKQYMESFSPSSFGSKRDLSEYFISQFDLEELTYEAVIHVSNDVEKIVLEIERSVPSITAIEEILSKHNIGFIPDSKIEDLSGFNFKKHKLFFLMIVYNESHINEIIEGTSVIDWHVLARRIGWIIGHEMIHNDQNFPIKDDNIIKKHATIGFDLNDPIQKKKYLSNIHEIMAFAYTIWKELESQVGNNKELMLKLCLKTPRNLTMFSDVAKDYFEVFDYNFQDKTLKRLLKYLYEYIQTVRAF